MEKYLQVMISNMNNNNNNNKKLTTGWEVKAVEVNPGNWES